MQQLYLSMTKGPSALLGPAVSHNILRRSLELLQECVSPFRIYPKRRKAVRSAWTFSAWTFFLFVIYLFLPQQQLMWLINTNFILRGIINQCNQQTLSQPVSQDLRRESRGFFSQRCGRRLRLPWLNTQLWLQEERLGREPLSAHFRSAASRHISLRTRANCLHLINELMWNITSAVFFQMPT